MDGAEPQDEQGLRAATRNRRDAPLRSNEPPDGQKIGSFMRLFRQFLIAVCNDIDPLPLCPLMCSLANNLGFLHFALTSIIRGGGSTAMTTAVELGAFLVTNQLQRVILRFTTIEVPS